MTFIEKFWVHKTVTGYRNILSMLRWFPEGLFYILSLTYAFIIVWAGISNAPTEKMLPAYSVFFVLHFALCFRLGLSVRGNIQPLSKWVWMFSLTTICVTLFVNMEGGNFTQYFKGVLVMTYLSSIPFLVGIMLSTLGEPFRSPLKPLTRFQKLAIMASVVFGVCLISFGQEIGQQSVYALEDIFDVTR